MTDIVAAALAAAQAQAAQVPPPVVPAVVTQAPSTPMVAPAAAPRSLQDLMQAASLNVDVFIAVKEYGLLLGSKDTKFHQTIDVEMRLPEIKSGYTWRYQAAGGAKYYTSYDGVTEARTRQPWGAACQDAMRMDPKSYGSDLAEIPVTLLSDVERSAGTPLKAGTRVGLSLSYQNLKEFMAWLPEMVAKHGMGATLKIRLGFRGKQNGGGTKYAVITYAELTN